MARSFSSLSIRWRLTATYVGLVAATVLVLGVALYGGFESFLLNDVEARTTADVARVVTRELDVKPSKDGIGAPISKPSKKPKPRDSAVPLASADPAASGLESAGPVDPGAGFGRGNSAAARSRQAIQKLGLALVSEVGGRDTSVVVLWPDRTVVAASVPIPDVEPWPVPTLDELDAAAASEVLVRRVDDRRVTRALLLIDAIRAEDGTVLAITAVATSLEAGDSALAQLRIALIVGLVAAIGLGVALGLPITRVALRPLDRVVRVAQRISAGDRGVRVGARDVPPEIARLGTAFDTMVERLEASAEAQRRFVADASHELRTPLAALGGMTEMLLLGIDQGDEAAVERVLTAMNREIGRLGRLAGDLLLLSRVEDHGGRLPLDIAEVGLTAVASEVVAELGSMLDERHVSIEVAPDILTVIGDADRIRQVLLNLVENAARYTTVGGRITIAAQADDGAPGTVPGAGHVRIAVTDDGAGLAPGDADRIFDRFYRADQSRAGAAGAGLGLSIVRAIAEAHGGRAEAASQGPGLGTTVSIILPGGRIQPGGRILPDGRLDPASLASPRRSHPAASPAVAQEGPGTVPADAPATPP